MEDPLRSKLQSLARLRKIMDQERRRGKKIVLTNGCFDLLHFGHLETLQTAKRRGDILVVALNSDSSVHALKGKGRPILPAHERAEMLAAFSCVDYVTIFSGRRPHNVIRAVRPHIHIKGGDYAPEDLPEKKLVESFGGRVIIAPLVPKHSTSRIIDKIRQGFLVFLILGTLQLFGSTAFAWKVTPELEKEIAEKEKIVQENAFHPHAYFDMAVTYGYSNKIMEGWDALKKVHALDPTYAPVALRKYLRLTKKSPKDRKLRFRLAFAYYFNGKKAESLKEFESLMQKDPKDIWPLGYIATILGEQNKVDEAIAVLQKALALDSDVAVLHVLLAQAYFKKGDQWNGVRESTEAVRLKALGF